MSTPSHESLLDPADSQPFHETSDYPAMSQYDDIDPAHKRDMQRIKERDEHDLEHLNPSGVLLLKDIVDFTIED